MEDAPTDQQFISTINQINFQKWYIPITLKIKDSFEFNTIALVDGGADQNCIKEGLIPLTYYEKTNNDSIVLMVWHYKLNINYQMLIYAFDDIVSKIHSF